MKWFNQIRNPTTKPTATTTTTRDAKRFESLRLQGSSSFTVAYSPALSAVEPTIVAAGGVFAQMP
jgi:hypothetical protein